MKMVTKASIANFKYNRGRNILVGIAVCLTTLLLFLVPGAAQAMVKLEFAAINEIYPTWHVVLRNVDSDIAEQVRVREDVETVGLRCDVGMIPADQATISLTALDQTCADLNRIELSEGRFPEKASEIIVSKGILDALGIEGKVGDTIRIPYQVLRRLPTGGYIYHLRYDKGHGRTKGETDLWSICGRRLCKNTIFQRKHSILCLCSSKDRSDGSV